MSNKTTKDNMGKYWEDIITGEVVDQSIYHPEGTVECIDQAKIKAYIKDRTLKHVAEVDRLMVFYGMYV